MQNSAVHILIDNKVTLSYLLKIEDMEGTCNQQLFSTIYWLRTIYGSIRSWLLQSISQASSV